MNLYSIVTYLSNKITNNSCFFYFYFFTEAETSDKYFFPQLYSFKMRDYS